MSSSVTTPRPESPGPLLAVAAPAAIPDQTTHTGPHLEPGQTAGWLADYAELFKTRVTAMIVLTAWAGFYLGSLHSGTSSMQPTLIAVLLGIGMVSAGAAAFNEAIEARSDARMHRTARRPMAAGRIGRAHGLTVAFAMSGLGALLLLREANGLTASLTLLTAASYVLIYTPLKRVTTFATFLGAFPGAMPPLLGWVAARGRIEWPAVALFAILFVWQFPHFMAISWLYREDYARAQIRMLPVVEPDGHSTARQALLYAVLMVPVSLSPYFLHIAGRPYAFAALVLSAVYLAYTLRFRRITTAPTPAASRMYARDLLKVSIIFLPVLLVTLMLNATHR